MELPQLALDPPCIRAWSAIRNIVLMATTRSLFVARNYYLNTQRTMACYFQSFYLWWVNPGWTGGAHHHHIVTVLFTGQERGNKIKSLWVKIRSGGDHSPITVIGKAYLTWGKLI